MSLLKKRSKIMFSFLLSLVFAFSLVGSVSAASVTLGPYGFQASSSVLYNSWYVNLPQDTVSLNVGITLDQYGIHANQAANVKYTLTDFSGASSYSVSQTVTGDSPGYTKSLLWTGLVAGRTYQLTAESLTSYDTVISFKIYAPDGTTVTQ